MTHSRTTLRWTAAAVALLGTAACQKAAAPDAALQHDLSQVEAERVELATPRPRTQFVSAVELGGEVAPAPKAPERARATPTRAPRMPRVAAATTRPVTHVAAAPAPAPEPTPEPTPEPVVERAPAPSEPIIAAPAPMPRRDEPRASSRRGGGQGTWTTADVIRNAPFPINP